MDTLAASRSIWTLSGIAAVVLGVLVNRHTRRAAIPFPPGPPGLPVLGNALQIPPTKSWLTFSKWARQYGDLVYATALGKRFLILHSQALITDLIEKRGTIYSDRSELLMGDVLVGYGQTVPRTRFRSPRFKQYRVMYANFLGPRAIREMHPFLQDQARQFALRLLESPSNLHLHTRWLTTNIVYMLSYGHAIEGTDDPIVKLAADVMEQFGVALTPGAWLVDVLPILRYLPEWFPGASFQKLVKEWRVILNRAIDEPFNRVREERAKGIVVPSFAMTLLEQKDTLTAEEETVAKWGTGAIWSGGSETTHSLLTTFFLAMTLYPEIQRKAQEELDRVIGRGSRLPTCEDRPNLPYLDAIFKETCRWNPIVVLGIPHELQEDDEYNGQFIPKGTMVIVNVWHILQDPSIYPDPTAFKPERFFPENCQGVLNPDPRGVTFGTGRRSCPGRFLAEASSFVNFATVLALFDITSPVGSDGRPVTTEAKFSEEVIAHPMPFDCKVTPRFSGVDKLVL